MHEQFVERSPCCYSTLVSLDPKEVHEFYIGEHCLKITAYVPKQRCLTCNKEYEDDDGRKMRNTAFRRAIDEFWRKNAASLLAPDSIQRFKWQGKRLVDAFGGSSKILVAQSLGMWLADCLYND